MRKKLSIIVAAGLFVGAISGAQASAPVKVFEDAVGDAGNQDSAVPGADQGGFDLLEGSIARAGKNLEFAVKHAAMPASGSLPEGFRFLWHIDVADKQLRFTVKSADIGKPDVVAQSGTERLGQVYLEGVFRLEECYIEQTPATVQLSQCTVLEYLDGAFDPAAQSFSFTLPLKTLKLKPGSEITPGTGGAAGTGCQICWVPHYAERSLTPYTIIDSTAMSVAYKVPKS